MYDYTYAYISRFATHLLHTFVGWVRGRALSCVRAKTPRHPPQQVRMIFVCAYTYAYDYAYRIPFIFLFLYTYLKVGTVRVQYDATYTYRP